MRSPYPYADLPVPVGSTHYEKVTVDANGCITAGIYQGACVVRVSAISPVPEPSIALLPIGFAAWRSHVRRSLRRS